MWVDCAVHGAISVCSDVEWSADSSWTGSTPHSSHSSHSSHLTFVHRSLQPLLLPPHACPSPDLCSPPNSTLIRCHVSTYFEH